MARWKPCFYVLVICCSWLRLAATLTTRGVALTKLPFYDSSRDFTCLDGSLTIPFSGVNDDYCDCKDGTDEPGTAACNNGLFHCTNAGYKPKNYPSSRVNDGICDCCDGSDEYEGKVACPDTCKELYKQEYEKRRQEVELAKQGFAKKQQLKEEGKDKKSERQTKLEELKAALEEKRKVVDDLRANKERIEAVEKEAKDKLDKEWEETKAQIVAQRDRELGLAAFKALDTDVDGRLMVAEVMQNQYLDKDYTEEEAKELLGGSDSADEGTFASKLWATFKDKYKPKQEETPADISREEPSDATPTEPLPTEAPVVQPPTPPPIDDTIDDDADIPDVGEDDDEDEGDDMRDAAAKRAAEIKHDDQPEPVKPEYDEDTKAKISEADSARTEFETADSSMRDIEREIGDIEKMLNIEFGDHEEYAALYGHCFEMRDKEYVYKLCPFEKAVQEPKDGGSQTSIGNWGEWNGSPNKFSRMKYTGGQNCWNGPDRSTTVIISCGTDNEIISVTEPSRCEYQMEFRTPAACEDHHTQHQEL